MAADGAVAAFFLLLCAAAGTAWGWDQQGESCGTRSVPGGLLVEGAVGLRPPFFHYSIAVTTGRGSEEWRLWEGLSLRGLRGSSVRSAAGSAVVTGGTERVGGGLRAPCDFPPPARVGWWDMAVLISAAHCRGSAAGRAGAHSAPGPLHHSPANGCGPSASVHWRQCWML